MLFLTSFLLIIPTFLAFYFHDYIFGTVLMGLYGVSILHHSHYANGGFVGDTVVIGIDKFLARYVAFYILISSWRCSSVFKIVNCFLLIYVYVVYFHIIQRSPEYNKSRVCRAMKYHITLHIATCIGATLCILDLHNTHGL